MVRSEGDQGLGWSMVPIQYNTSTRYQLPGTMVRSESEQGRVYGGRTIAILPGMYQVLWSGQRVEWWKAAAHTMVILPSGRRGAAQVRAQ